MLKIKDFVQIVNTDIKAKEILDGAINYLLEGGDVENAAILQTCSITEVRVTWGVVGLILGFI